MVLCPIICGFFLCIILFVIFWGLLYVPQADLIIR